MCTPRRSPGQRLPGGNHLNIADRVNPDHGQHAKLVVFGNVQASSQLPPPGRRIRGDTKTHDLTDSPRPRRLVSHATPGPWSVRVRCGNRRDGESEHICRAIDYPHRAIYVHLIMNAAAGRLCAPKRRLYVRMHIRRAAGSPGDAHLGNAGGYSTTQPHGGRSAYPDRVLASSSSNGLRNVEDGIHGRVSWTRS